MMPNAESRGAVIVFDGVCVLCNGWVGFLLRHDRAGRYRFAAMQSEAGRALLARHGLEPDDPASFLLLEYDVDPAPRASIDTDAIRRVLVGLGGCWTLANAIALLPRGLCDAAYRWLASNRYRWFGRHEACALPAPEHRQRFL